MKLFFILTMIYILPVYTFDISKRIFISMIGNSVLLSNYKLNNTLHQEVFKYKQPDSNNNIFFFGGVDDDNMQNLHHLLIDMDNENKKKPYTSPEPIHLHIKSYGGDVIPALSLVDTITNLQTPVYTHIDGYAASAATLISIVGKKRYMNRNSLMLIHQISSSQNGKYSELKNNMANLDTLTEIIKNLYLNYTLLNPEQLDNLLSKDLWLNSNLCMKYGLVDEII